MKLATLTIASALFAVHAVAQTDSGNSTGNSTDASTTTTNQSAETSQSDSGSAMAQSKVRDQLTKAGFQNVEILDASYLVRAQTEDGNTVLMVIDPPIGGTSGDASTSSDAEQKTNN
ncbi:exported protein of unknown function (plasmid) [Pseudorhizobium banfieldiae]|uniref:PepSY domain-containing protein n=1 Tax=Pseudorhizobium banfieldiae TaxID=1125847 RepID=L0NM99_9HYPH|nr:hypothetical protein [Pseudorhizobium banfieldiae]CAD6628232.1 hypothetical protein RTCK_03959 [Rhizobium sp. TCK]CAD6628802.1 hypothetical protein RNT25_04216 [arsenite-oxidising bacterium NT-25]CCF22208.1 exported protein of unknown function [Pseudorhizobium banfieldiae]